MGKARGKETTESYRTLNIISIRCKRLLNTGAHFDWCWWQNGRKVASISITVESRDSLRLRYQSSSRNSEPTQYDYPVTVAWTPCHFGGERPWLCCPSCGRRAAKLYGGVVFACRQCWRLNYASQQVSRRDRAADRSWRLRQALGCVEGFLSMPAEYIQKPKGMHWRTFNCKIERLKQVEDTAMTDTQILLAGIERKLTALSRR